MENFRLYRIIRRARAELARPRENFSAVERFLIDSDVPLRYIAKIGN